MGVTTAYVRRRCCASCRWQILVLASACARAPAHVCTIVDRCFVLKLQACDKIVVFIQYIQLKTILEICYRIGKVYQICKQNKNVGLILS